MKVLFFVDGFLPYPSGAGSSVMTWATLKFLVDSGVHTNLIFYGNASLPWTAKAVNLLQEIGVHIYFLPWQCRKVGRKERILRTVLARPEYFWPTHVFQTEVVRVIQTARPDVAYLYSKTFILSRTVSQEVPTVISVIDNPIDQRRAARRYKGFGSQLDGLYAFLDWVTERNLGSLWLSMLKPADKVIAHAYNTFEWLRQHGVEAHYLPNPVEDKLGTVGGSCLKPKRLCKGAPESSIRISLIGNLHGVSTLAGLHYFKEKILPLLRPGKTSPYEFHVIGGGSLPEYLADLREHPLVVFRGYVPDIAREFLSTDILLVPTPVPLGFRTRIAEGFSYGCVVVAHEANKAGMPELQSFENCILCSRPEEFVHAFDLLRNDPDLYQKISFNARRTFEQHYCSSVVASKMIDLFHWVISDRDINK